MHFQKFSKTSLKRGEKMKKFIGLIMVISLMLMTTSAFAISITAGPLTMHLTSWEVRVDTVGNVLSGIVQVDQILDVDSNEIWSNSASEELVGNFGGLLCTTYGGYTAGNHYGFSDGAVNLYLDSTPDFDPTSPGSGVTDGELYLQLDFVTGRNGAYPNDTLSSTVTGIGGDPEGTPSIYGAGQALLDVTGGSAGYIFDTNTYARYDGSGLYADMSMDMKWFVLDDGIDGTDFSNLKNGWPVWNKDPIGANAIPEPATMLLLGTGLIGLAGIGRRKFFKKA